MQQQQYHQLQIKTVFTIYSLLPAKNGIIQRQKYHFVKVSIRLSMQTILKFDTLLFSPDKYRNKVNAAQLGSGYLSKEFSIAIKLTKIAIFASRMKHRVIEISSLAHPDVEMFSTLTEAQLRNRLEPGQSIFIAESPKVIRVALNAGYEPLALLCERRHITGDAAEIIERCGDIPIYTGERELLAALTGYVLTRGVLCAMRRPMPRSLNEVCKDAHRIAVIHNVVDTTNIGAIFRSAAALGIDAVLLTPSSCDPLNRRAVRVSMGSVFLVPWTWLDGPLTRLNELGFRTAAMALTEHSISIDDPLLTAEPKLAIVMGTEGDGLPMETIAEADFVVRIPMSHGVDSLNVAAASAVAFWQLRKV